MSDLKVGDTVYYNFDNFDAYNEKPIISCGVIERIVTHDVHVEDKVFKDITFYWIKGMGMMRNSLFTIEDLFEIKNRLENVMNTHDLKTLIGDDNK